MRYGRQDRWLGGMAAVVFLAGWFFDTVVAAPTACSGAVTPISRIQGRGMASPLQGRVVTVEGVVTLDMTADEKIGGFFVHQTPAYDDGDPQTSEGLFIYARADVKPGQRLRLTGTVKEFRGITEMTGVQEIVACGWDRIQPEAQRLPLSTRMQWERLENMLVFWPQPLHIVDNSRFRAAGELTLSHRRRLYVPTMLAEPGAAARALARKNAAARLVLDLRQFPDVLTGETIRIGTPLQPLAGIVSDHFAGYRVFPLAPPEAGPVDVPRELPAREEGRSRVVFWNLQNFFNGDGRGRGFPAPRGPRSRAAFLEKKQGVTAVLTRIDAGLIGLAELENDGFGRRSALTEITAALNRASEHRRYVMAQPDSPAVGTDEIAVGLLFDRKLFEPLGAAVVPADDPASLNRPPLLQALRHRPSGRSLGVAVVHLKSKHCRGAKGKDRDRGDGQGCWVQTRVRAVRQLLRSVQTTFDTRTEMVLIMGDLNSYARETPVAVLREAGYEDVLARSVALAERYTYVHKGLSGYLDYFFVNRGSGGRYSDVAVWHRFSDLPPAPRVHKRRGAKTGRFDGLLRISDHDPVLMHLSF